MMGILKELFDKKYFVKGVLADGRKAKNKKQPVHESRETPVADAYTEGIETIQRVTETAVKRMLSLGDAAANQSVLFTQAELAAIAAAIGQSTAIARAVGEEEARKQIERQAVEAELENLTQGD